jgi:Tol biopolymer transport system component
MTRIICVAWLLVAAVPCPAQDAKRRPMEIDDLFRFKRIADPQISPDGKWVVYVQGVVDLEKNRTTKNLWLASTHPDQAGKPRQLTASDKSDGHPRWSPDGKHILFESNRSGSSQLWVIALEGGEARQLTTISTGAGTGIWSRDGKQIAFVQYREETDATPLVFADVWRMRADGSHVHRVSTSPEWDFRPDWS